MKKLIQLILAGIMIVPMSLNAQQDSKKFVGQYKKQDGFTVVTIGKPVMTMLSLFAKVGMDKEAAQTLKCVHALQVLSFDCRWDKTRGERFNSEALNFCNANNYEELIEVVEHNETVKIFGKTEGETITGLIVLNSSNRASSVDMVCIKGKFSLDELSSITGSFGKKIASN